MLSLVLFCAMDLGLFALGLVCLYEGCETFDEWHARFWSEIASGKK